MPRARWSDPEESHEAAASVTNVTEKQQAVLDCLTGLHLTDHALGERYESLRAERGWPEQSESGLRTRRSELVDRGLVEKTGRGKLPSGRNAAIWAVARRGAGESVAPASREARSGNPQGGGADPSSDPVALPMFEIPEEKPVAVNHYQAEEAF